MAIDVGKFVRDVEKEVITSGDNVAVASIRAGVITNEGMKAFRDAQDCVLQDATVALNTVLSALKPLGREDIIKVLTASAVWYGVKEDIEE
jgi:hypothetical protein